MTKPKPPVEQPIGYTHKYKRLYDLGSDRIDIIESMLTAGDSSMTVAERVKDEWNQCPQVKINTLEKQIRRYHNDILKPKLALAVEKASQEGITVPAALKKFREQVDVMERLNDAINMQWARIQKAFTKEDKKGTEGKLDGGISKELRSFTDMCRVLAGLQLETGVVRRVPKQVQGFFQNLDSGELQEFRLEMTHNDETLKALGQIKDVLQEAAGEIIDGDYVPLESEPPKLSVDNGEVVE